METSSVSEQSKCPIAVSWSLWGMRVDVAWIGRVAVVKWLITALRWTSCLIGRHEWWVRARMGVCRAEEQCAICGATRLCMNLDELVVHKGDIVWFDSAIIRKAEQERRLC